MRTTCLYIQGDALTHNASLIRAALPERVRLMAVVKADGYGHGAVYAARAFLKGGASALAVALAEEAQRLRQEGVDCPILVLGGGEADSLSLSVEVGASQAVFTPDMLKTLNRAASRCGRQAKAHLKIDTGMSRIGVRSEQALEDMLDAWKECPMVDMEGVFTHFCVAETDPEFTALQNGRFLRAVETVRKAGYAPIAHAAASGSFENPDFQHDMVRPGLAMYGFGAKMKGLLPAQRLSARPVRIQRIQPGDTVSYGRTFRAERETLVATIPIGYGDGYSRLFSNRACALVNGVRAPQIGRVCMDMTMFDVTDVPGVSLQSEFVLMGSQGSDCISPEEMADWIGTIPYEVMLGFHSRVRRIFE